MMLSAAAYPSFVAAYALLAWCVQYEHLPAPSVITVIVPGVLCALTFIPSMKTQQTQTHHQVLHTVLTATPSFRRQQTCEGDAADFTPIAASQPGLCVAEMTSVVSAEDNNGDESLKMPPMMDEPVQTSALVVGAQC